MAGDVVIDFHEDNNTAVTVLRSGWSSTMRHLERTHGVCLRALAEQMRRPYFCLMYERSALMAADIYTKAFTGKAGWELACRLINHIRPHDFWSGKSVGHSCMLSEHKGGIFFDYWTSNPWACQASDRGLVPLGEPLVPVAAVVAGRYFGASWTSSSLSPLVARDQAQVLAGAAGISDLIHPGVDKLSAPFCTSSTSSFAGVRPFCVEEKDASVLPASSTFCRGPRKPRWKRKK